jgi:ubiquinone/menaquinone biosynthesis C-methylase UbiE
MGPDAANSGNVERFSGFAEEYDTCRPGPPSVLKPILLDLVQVPRLRLVADLGSGTGLSTRYWADAADQVVGIEPNEDMRARAAAVTTEANVEYRHGTSSATGLSDQAADIVTCGQSLHWMEPAPTFEEVARILRQGGVFAAYDFDWPPTTGVWQAEQAYQECMHALSELDDAMSREKSVRKWSKSEHLRRMTESRSFRYTKEVVLHHSDEGDAQRFIGLLLSQGGVRTLLKAGRTEKELGIIAFRKLCHELLGRKKRAWYWSARVRIGVK